MAEPDPAPPATLVIFGATGDLSHRLLMPSLITMTATGLVDDGLRVIGIGRSPMSDEELRQGIEAFDARNKGEAALTKDGRTADAWRRLRDRITYFQGDIADRAMFDRLRDTLAAAGAKNVAFYLATAPQFFGDIAGSLGAAGLLDETDGFRRIAIEKPFGHDLASARALNACLQKVAQEEQVYRIDHFLGKETVQNIMVARFANTMMEAVWNNHYVDHVQITVAETVDVGTRGEFYDATGALRDMVPNHLFQLLAMVAMEPPNSFDAEAIRNEKGKVFAAVRGPRGDGVARDAVRGAYTAGTIGETAIGDYRAAPNVAADSRTETYAALKLAVDSWRWAGVPFYLRTGKALSHRDSEIVITFRPVPIAQFRDTSVTQLPANRMVIQIQPNEGISIDFVAKRPGPELDPAPVAMNFCYADEFDVGHTTGYETLLYDMLTGDQTLFQRADGIEAAWAAIEPVLEAWAAAGEPEPYVAGGAGPDAADAMIARDGRAWHRLGS